MRLTTARAALLAVALVGATACGGSSGTDASGDTEPEVAVDEPSTEPADPDSIVDEQPYVDAIATGLGQSPELPMDRDTAQCVGRAVVDEVDVRAMDRAGVTPADIGDLGSGSLPLELGAEGRIATSLVDCKLEVAFTPAMANAFGIPDAEIECLARSFAQNFAVELAHVIVQGDDGTSGDALAARLFAGVPGTCVRSVIVEALVRQGVATLAQGRCLEDKIPEELARRMLTLEYQQDPGPLNAELEPIVRFCA